MKRGSATRGRPRDVPKQPERQEGAIHQNWAKGEGRVGGQTGPCATSAIPQVQRCIVGNRRLATTARNNVTPCYWKCASLIYTAGVPPRLLTVSQLQVLWHSFTSSVVCEQPQRRGETTKDNCHSVALTDEERNRRIPADMASISSRGNEWTVIFRRRAGLDRAIDETSPRLSPSSNPCLLIPTWGKFTSSVGGRHSCLPSEELLSPLLHAAPVPQG
ncbi:hypothetical protein SKAU_G00381070 [Synaphobranchus kaupii]|uniref:Uncharacterized protein n=1 Tax=Synaphobranchus kaupii TaxID=118154 RepID=A0A9Q1IEN6_SYNKA|nr:hypothetical protein SKAU_G00381070 [Synaphobranchus kaupii]